MMDNIFDRACDSVATWTDYAPPLNIIRIIYFFTRNRDFRFFIIQKYKIRLFSAVFAKMSRPFPGPVCARQNMKICIGSGPNMPCFSIRLSHANHAINLWCEREYYIFFFFIRTTITLHTWAKIIHIHTHTK